MKYLILAFTVLVVLPSCNKEEALPRLSFSQQERKWFTYQLGQRFSFKTTSGEAITYVVDSVKNFFITENKDPLRIQLQ